MRRAKSLLAAALGVLALAAPVAAQVQQGNPNAANQSLSNAGQARAAQQSQTTQNNMNRMGAGPGTASAPPPAQLPPRPSGIR